jgi:hypothetical protein
MEIEKMKKALRRKHPNAQLVVDSNGLFYIENEQGRDIANLNISNQVENFCFDYGEDSWNRFNRALDSEPQIPHSNTVLGAWNNAYTAMKAYHIIGVNSDIFNPEKSEKSLE